MLPFGLVGFCFVSQKVALFYLVGWEFRVDYTPSTGWVYKITRLQVVEREILQMIDYFDHIIHLTHGKSYYRFVAKNYEW